jgi:hypothetical protein
MLCYLLFSIHEHHIIHYASMIFISCIGTGESHSSGIQAEPRGAATGAGGASPEEAPEGDIMDCPDYTPCTTL